MSNTQDFEYDESEAIKFIRKQLPADAQSKYSDDEINYILDIIYEFYEENGFMSEEEADEEETVEFSEEELLMYVMKCVKRDKIKPFAEEDVLSIIQGELDYCESLNIFNK